MITYKQAKALASKDKARQKSRDAMTAIEGNIVTIDKAVGYASAGDSYRINNIDGRGCVSIINTRTNGGTSWSPTELFIANRAGVKFGVIQQ
jgi:hypothetical protein